MEGVIPAAVAIAASIIAAAWCLTHGSTISASATVERGRPSVWGVSLHFLGVLILVYGFIAGHMLLVGGTPLITLIGWLLLMLGMVHISITSRGGSDEEGLRATLGGLGTWGIITAFIIVVSAIFMAAPGGEGVMIPEAAWPLLMGMLTMVGAAFAAAICIIAAVEAGSEMLREKPELSIWSLLFVALGEGLAIYGLIVAILLLTA
jgi:V/A-type H+-transporting ATPase subunit K